jgi:hypothetical protein
MHDGRSKSAWGHTSAIMALIANVNRDPTKKSEPFRVSDFNPYVTKPKTSKPDIPKVKMKSLKNVLMGLVPRNGKS